jgi:kinesin family protein 2/24
MEANNTPKIRVVVRKRPPNRKELSKQDPDIMRVENNQHLVVRELKTKVDMSKYIEEHKFTFDNVYGEDSTNEDIYLECVQPIVAAAFEGAKVSCFAYGQTGSGKTFTMMGPNPTERTQKHPGIYLQAATDIFTLLNYEEYVDYTVTASLYEIYCGKLHDLLNKRKEVQARCDAKERVKIMGLTEAPCSTADDLMQVINYGLTERTTGTTTANADSSRSHAIMQIILRGPNHKVVGKMSFIDLAGSERGADNSEANKKTRQDGAEINKSLLALKECIRALDKDQKHTPFRGSKLTQVLKDSFIGNCKTVMIANVSPCQSCCENTLNSLRYADRVKELKNENRDKSDSLMLARNASNTTKKEIKKQHSFETNIIKVKNLPVALQRTESVPIDSNIFANKVSNLQFERLKSAKPQPASKLISSARPQGQVLQNNKSPKFRQANGFGGGLQINSKTKNYDELNENIQSIHSMIGQQRSDTYQSERKQPFATQDGNKQQIQRQLEAKPQKINYDDLQMDDCDQESLGLEQICHDHESLVNLILQEEEDLLSSHRKYIDDIVDSVKKQMVLLHEVDKPGSNVDSYISSLDTMLLSNVNMIMGVRKQLKTFERHLKEEEVLSQKFYEQQQDQDMEHNEVDEMFDEQVRRNPGRGGPGEFNMHDDEFMDDLDYLEVTPSEPPLEDNLVNPGYF